MSYFCSYSFVTGHPLPFAIFLCNLMQSGLVWSDPKNSAAQHRVAGTGVWPIFLHETPWFEYFCTTKKNSCGNPNSHMNRYTHLCRTDRNDFWWLISHHTQKKGTTRLYMNGNNRNNSCNSGNKQTNNRGTIEAKFAWITRPERQRPEGPPASSRDP